jgi:hypothetical protein
MMLASNRPGRELTRRSVVPSLLLPDRNDVLVLSSFGVAPPTATAVVGGYHRSVIIVPLLQTIAIIILVLLLPPERMPMPDPDSRPRRVTYNNDGGPARIHVCGLSGVEDVLHCSIYSLLRPLGSIGSVICATYDARSKLHACVHPSSPPSMPSLIFPPSRSQ